MKELRVAGNDPAAVGRVLDEGVPDDGLQHAGQAVLRCPLSSALDASMTALLDALSRRNWTGDAELIAELVHAHAGTVSTLTALQVGLDEVGEALDQAAASESYIDLADGTLWPGAVFDVGQEPEDFDADDSLRWLLVASTGSKPAYVVMELFIATIESPGLASRLRSTISGSGAFRRFQTELSLHDDEYTRWHRFRDDARLGRARAWLADHGYRSAV